MAAEQKQQIPGASSSGANAVADGDCLRTDAVMRRIGHPRRCALWLMGVSRSDRLVSRSAAGGKKRNWFLS